MFKPFVSDSRERTYKRHVRVWHVFRDMQALFKSRPLLAVLLAYCFLQVSNVKSAPAESAPAARTALSMDLAELLELLQRLHEALTGGGTAPETVALELVLRLVATFAGEEIADRAACAFDALLATPELGPTLHETLESAQLVWQLYEQRERELAECEALGSGLLPSVASALQRACILNVQATTGADLNTEYARLTLLLARLRVLLDPALLCALAAA